MKLIRVDRTGLWSDVLVSEQAHSVSVINPNHLDPEDPMATRAEFFQVHRDNEVDIIVEALAKKNPGLEIQVFDLKTVSWCPAGDMQTKEVTNAGVMPRIF